MLQVMTVSIMLLWSLGDYRFLNATSQFEDFSNEQVVTFDLSGIQDTELLNIQLYQVLSIISSYAVANGRRVSEYFRRGIIGEIRASDLIALLPLTEHISSSIIVIQSLLTF